MLIRGLYFYLLKWLGLVLRSHSSPLRILQYIIAVKHEATVQYSQESH